jgi:hypothetical protein
MDFNLGIIEYYQFSSLFSMMLNLTVQVLRKNKFLRIAL